MDNKFDPSKWYENYYSKINTSADSSSLAFRFLHKAIEKGQPDSSGKSILEIGANIGEHIEFVSPNWERYVALDFHLPSPEIIKKYSSKQVEFIDGDAHCLPFHSDTFDRVILTCVMHHVSDPQLVLKELLRVLKIGGTISLALPNDPGIFYRILRHLTSVRKAKAVNLKDELELVHALEHKNHFLSLANIIYWVYRDQRIRKVKYPGLFGFWQLNFLTIFTVEKVKRISHT